LTDAVKQSTSVAGVLRHLGLNQAGGTHAHISRMIKRFEIDTSHFVRYQSGGHKRRRCAADILVRIPYGSKRTPPLMLRRALLEIGRVYACALCDNPGEWLGRPLRLEIDHVDGDYHNNVATNLRYLCPNCHTQTDNFSGRSWGKYTSGQGQPPTSDSLH
jgi:hypothetical protein